MHIDYRNSIGYFSRRLVVVSNYSVNTKRVCVINFFHSGDSVIDGNNQLYSLFSENIDCTFIHSVTFCFS